MAASSEKPTLTLPPSIFAAVAPSSYFHAHLALPTPIRPNGRQLLNFRKPHFNLHSLTHAQGSAIVRTGDTSVVCGIRAEILLASDADTELRHREDYHEDEDGVDDGGEDVVQRLGLVVPNVDMATGCAPGFLPGQATSKEAQDLSERLRLVLNQRGLFDPEQFRIWEHPKKGETEDSDSNSDSESSDDTSMSSSTDSSSEETSKSGKRSKKILRALWTLYVDVVVIALDGNAFDAILAAAVAALSDTLLPKATWDADISSIICSPLRRESTQLQLQSYPFSATFRIFRVAGDDFAKRSDDGEERRAEVKTWVIADPNLKEDGLCNEYVTFVLSGARGKADPVVNRLEKTGGKPLDPKQFVELSRLALERWSVWRECLKEASGNT